MVLPTRYLADELRTYHLGLSHAKFTKDVLDTLTYAVRVLASHPPEEQVDVAQKLVDAVKAESRNLDSLSRGYPKTSVVYRHVDC